MATDSAAVNDEDSSKLTTPLPIPYSSWWHPEKSWIDISIGWFLVWLLPLSSVKQFAPCKNSMKAIECIDGLRATLRKLLASSFRSKTIGPFFLWAKAAESDIVDYSYTIPRRPNVLREWDICQEDEDVQVPTCEDDIRVNLFFPVSMMQHIAPGMDLPKETNDFGCLPISMKDGHHLDLTRLPKSTPIVIYFHGGGLTIGDSYDNYGIAMIQKLSKIMPNDKPIILASVDYSLAPELPFPTAAMEALTVVGHFCELLETHKIHLAGISAGGNLATVASMEAFRKYPGRIRSSLICCPMLNPACDSLTFHLNSTSSPVPVEYLQWCWQAYLELPQNGSSQMELPQNGSSQNIEKTENGPVDTLDDLLGLDSNRKAWNESKWKNSSLERLVNPVVAIPASGWKDNATYMAPKILVQTNRGDPLKDEGVELFNKLRLAGADVTHIDAGGSHWMGLPLEQALYNSMLETWKDAILASA
jgi:acetyl esterase/lipase